MDELVEVTVNGVERFLLPEAAPELAEKLTVVLKEREGPRRLPIWIGPTEAFAIASQLSGQTLARPLAADLVAGVIRELEATLTRVTITSHRESVFYAVLSLEHEGKEAQFDARPSDAIAVALRLGAPIFVGEQLFEQAAAAV
jgi:bifunctional DNase/RNase